MNLAQNIYYVDKNERYLLVFTSCIIEKNCNPFELKKEKKTKTTFRTLSITQQNALNNKKPWKVLGWSEMRRTYYVDKYEK